MRKRRLNPKWVDSQEGVLAEFRRRARRTIEQHRKDIPLVCVGGGDSLHPDPDDARVVAFRPHDTTDRERVPVVANLHWRWSELAAALTPEHLHIVRTLYDLLEEQTFWAENAMRLAVIEMRIDAKRRPASLKGGKGRAEKATKAAAVRAALERRSTSERQSGDRVGSIARAAKCSRTYVRRIIRAAER